MHKRRGFEGEGTDRRAWSRSTAASSRSDIDTFAKCFGLKPPPIHGCVPVGIPRSRCRPENETTLDLEMLTAGAPGLDRILRLRGRRLGAGILLSRRHRARLPGPPARRDLDLARLLRGRAGRPTSPSATRFDDSLRGRRRRRHLGPRLRRRPGLERLPGRRRSKPEKTRRCRCSAVSLTRPPRPT